MRLALTRLNRILIPTRAAGSERPRPGPVPRRRRVISWFFTRWSREGRILLVTTCVASMFTVDVGRTESHALIFATFALLCISLCFTRLYRLADVTLTARAPRRVSVGDELGVTLALKNLGQRAHRALRLELPALPADGSWSHAGTPITDLGPGEQTSHVLRARFTTRGVHRLAAFRAAAILPLGLAQGAPLRTEQLRFVVVPKPARVVSLKLPTNPQQQPGGTAHASRMGDATALLGVRPYRPGDPVRDLHARSWARHGAPIVREYQEETFSRVGLLLDIQANAAGAEQLEAGLSLSAGVIAWLGRTEERVDLLVIGEHSEQLPVGHAQATLDHALDLLAAVKASPNFNADRILASLGPHLTRLSSVVFVTLGWDEHRASVATAIRTRGLGCLVLIVAEQSARSLDERRVSREAVLKGEALSL